MNQGFRPEKTVLLAFGHDEEIGGKAGAGQIAALLKNRGTRVSYAIDEGSVVTLGIVPGLAGRAALVGIAEKGYASVELSVNTLGGNSSMPPARTAIGIVAATVSAARESSDACRSRWSGGSHCSTGSGPKMPFWPRLPLANRWLFGSLIVRRLEESPTTNAILRTTTAATIFEGGVKDNVLPAYARAVVNFRIKPGDTVDHVLAHVDEGRQRSPYRSPPGRA